MSITYVNASGTAPNVNADGSVKADNSASSIDKNQFLTLLVTELKNQDPTAPVDQKDTLAQLAQFSSLEQVQNLNQTLTAQGGFSALSQSAGLIGKTVTTSGDTVKAGVTGVVTAVSVQAGKPFLHIGGQDVDASTLTNIQ